MFVPPLEQVRTLTWSGSRTLLLLAEVFSPSSVPADRFVKRLHYREAGVPLYWVVRGDERTIQRERLVWHPAGAPEASCLSRRCSAQSDPPRTISE
jgi:Uma2 family endonuclease